MKKREIDHSDVLIINELGQDASLNNKSLARKIGLSESATYVRLNKLREKGVIKETKAKINLEYFGFDIQVVLFISVVGQSVDQLIKNVIGAREVYHCAELQTKQFVTGSRKFFIQINAQSQDYVTIILKRLFDQVQHIHFELFSLEMTVKDDALLISMHDFEDAK